MADSLGRSNKWTFIIYPESTPKNFLDILQNSHIQGAVSPLHDADINGDGAEKKPHYHVYLYFGSGAKQSESQIVENFVKPLNGTKPFAVSTEYGLIRYFVHLDNPEKAQYKQEDIICLSGFSVDDCFKPPVSKVNAIMNEMKQWVIDNDVTEYLELQKKAFTIESWAYVLNMYNCFSVYKLIDSQRNYIKSLSKSCTVDSDGVIL